MPVLLQDSLCALSPLTPSPCATTWQSPINSLQFNEGHPCTCQLVSRLFLLPCHYFFLFSSRNPMPGCQTPSTSDAPASVPPVAFDRDSVPAVGTRIRNCTTCQEPLFVKATADNSNINFERRFIACDNRSHKGFTWLEPIVHLPHEWVYCDCGFPATWVQYTKSKFFACWKEKEGCGFKAETKPPKYLHHEDCSLCNIVAADALDLQSPTPMSQSSTQSSLPPSPARQLIARRTSTTQPQPLVDLLPVTMVQAASEIHVYTLLDATGQADPNTLTISWSPPSVPEGGTSMTNDLGFVKHGETESRKRTLSFPVAVDPKPTKKAHKTFTHWVFKPVTSSHTF